MFFAGVLYLGIAFFGKMVFTMGGPARTPDTEKGERFMGGRKRLVIESKWCKGCGICAAFCPAEALELSDGRVRLKEDNRCVL